MTCVTPQYDERATHVIIAACHACILSCFYDFWHYHFTLVSQVLLSINTRPLLVVCVCVCVCELMRPTPFPLCTDCVTFIEKMATNAQVLYMVPRFMLYSASQHSFVNQGSCMLLNKDFLKEPQQMLVPILKQVI